MVLRKLLVFNCTTILYGVVTYYNVVNRKKCKPIWENKGNDAYVIKLQRKWDWLAVT